jgi:galactose mutarotase-like enzyme
MRRPEKNSIGTAMSDDQALVSIRSAGLVAEINPMGAELHALRDAEGRDLLWDGDPTVWAGRAPILFPIIGELAEGRYHWQGGTYNLPRHGFARRSLFEVVEEQANTATFQLRWSEATFAVYPFRFQLDIRFAVRESTLVLTVLIRNLDASGPMLASFGFHPAFRWPLPFGEPRAAHRLAFDQPEPEPIRRLDKNGLVLPTLFSTPVEGLDLPLDDALFADDAVIFDQVRSGKLRYGAAEGPQLEIAFPQTSRLGVWSKPGAGFVCIEPWHGVADPEGFKGDLSAKPGIFPIEPAQSVQLSMSIALIA